MSEMVDPAIMRALTEKIVERMLLQMEVYNKTLQFRHPRLLSQMMMKSAKKVPYKLARALTRLTWNAKHYEAMNDPEADAYAKVLWSMIVELVQPYTDMYQPGWAVEKDAFMGTPDEDRIKLLDAHKIVDDVMEEIEGKD